MGLWLRGCRAWPCLHAPLWCLRGLWLGVLHLFLLRCGGVIRVTHYSAGPKPWDLGRLCWDTQYIVHQGHGGPLLSPGKIIG